MKSFNNKRQITEWLVHAENHFTMFKANLECEENAHRFIDKTTKGLVYRDNLKDCATRLKQSIDSIMQYVDED